MSTPRRGTGRRLGLNGYASILRDLQLEAMTAEALAAKHGLTVNRANHILRSLRAVNLARVKSWQPRQRASAGYSSVWCFGGGPDAPHPNPDFGIAAERSKNLTPTVITLSYLLRELVRSSCLSKLAAATGSDYQVISRFLAHGHNIGLCHISRWQFQRGGVTAFWRLGDQPHAERPAPKPRSETLREMGERRKLRRQQQATFRALTHQLAQPFGGLLP